MSELEEKLNVALEQAKSKFHSYLEDMSKWTNVWKYRYVIEEYVIEEAEHQEVASVDGIFYMFQHKDMLTVIFGNNEILYDIPLFEKKKVFFFLTKKEPISNNIYEKFKEISEFLLQQEMKRRLTSRLASLEKFL